MPQNPLDILAQQTVAACALGPVDVEGWYETVKRSAPFRTLPRSAYEATLDLLAGRFPSDEFAELRPRLVWDRDHGHAHRAARRAAHRGDERRHDPRPRSVRRLRRGRVAERAGRRARRGDGLRVARERRVHARHDELAHRRDHPRPRERPARVRPAGQAAVLARRRPRAAGRARRGARQVLARGVGRDPREGPRSPARSRPRRQRIRQPARLPRRAARGHRHPPDRQVAHGRAQPRRGRRLARDPSFPVRHEGARTVGAGRQRPHPRAPRASRDRRSRATTASSRGFRMPRPSRPARSCSSSNPTSSSRS